MKIQDFEKQFNLLTGHLPFPWQIALYDRFASDRKDNIPDVAALPTGLGKTNVIAVWLLARIASPQRIPRRMVYVVNRRTVVDQTTNEVERLREKLPALNHSRVKTLAISTLRGQFADNAEWSADPSRPAVICGTVDMIGSRLLFEGYRIGFKSRPLHAGFLGQDALLVHDEAHLEPAFQELIETIQDEQLRERKRSGDLPWPSLRVMALSATARTHNGEASTAQYKPFELTNEEKQPPEQIPDPPTEPIHDVWRRLTAKKALCLHACDDEKKKLAVDVVAHATVPEHLVSGDAILVFVRKVEDAEKVADGLRQTLKKEDLPEHVATLTGTMRGHERDELVKSNKVFVRFMPPGDRSEGLTPIDGTVYLVCTSAGEVGVNLSADHMVCDLSTFDSMAQRLGRVNRFGDRDDTRVDVVHPKSFGKVDKKTGELKADEMDKRRKHTLDLLQKLPAPVEDPYDASPLALGNLDADARLAAFAPEPTILPATDILFDAWALTTIKGKMPGRPPVAPYLHGVSVAEWEPPRTTVAWRSEVEIITNELLEREGTEFPSELLDDFPLKPHELLSDRTDRVLDKLQALIAEPNKSLKGEKRRAALQRAERNAAANVWLIGDDGAVTVTTLGELLDDDKKRLIARLADGTILLPPSVGGLAGGMFDGASEHADDVADIANGTNQRIRIWTDDSEYDARISAMRWVRSIELAAGEDEDAEPRRWEWYESTPLEGGRTASKPVTWQTHVDDVVNHAQQIFPALSLPPQIRDAVLLAAELHDHGKRRAQFQRTLGNRNYPTVLLAKSGKKGARLPESFRHEFASVLDAQDDEAYDKLDDDLQDLVLHMIAAHHGRARPHFTLDEAFDPERPSSDAEALAIETPRRFARLQRKYGRWGLAYLESLLRAADWAASAAPSKVLDVNGKEVTT
jgi:CRISPR-associated endonuclease/helicase Cas3